MAKIKTFQGEGPNPNVPFSQLPQSRFFGAAEDAVAKVANNFSNQAVQYADFQKKQTDTKDVITYQAEKEKALQSLRANSLKPDGTYDTELIEKGITEFDNQAKQGMSGRAYENYQQREIARNGHAVASLANENLKITRQNNKAVFLQGLDSLGQSSMVGSFEDMSINAETMKASVVDAVGSGTLDQFEGDEVLKKSFNQLSKTYLEMTTTITSDNLNEVRDSFQKAEAFIQLDPFGVYKENPLLADQSRAKLAGQRLKAVNGIQNRQIRQANIQENLLKKQQLQNFNDISSALLEATSAPDGVVSQDSQNPYAGKGLAEIQLDAQDLYKKQGVSEYQISNLANFTQRQAMLSDNFIIEQVLQNPANAAPLLSKIQTPVGKSEAARLLEQNLPESYSNRYKTVKDSFKSLNTVKYLQDIYTGDQAVSQLPQNPQQFDARDVEYWGAITQNTNNMTPESSTFRYNYIKYLREEKGFLIPSDRAAQLKFVDNRRKLLDRDVKSFRQKQEEAQKQQNQ